MAATKPVIRRPNESRDIPTIPARIGAITLFVEQLPRTKSFYQKVFGAPAVFEDENSAVFAFGDTVVNLLRVAEAPSLLRPAAVTPFGAGASFILSIWVDDVDAICAILAELDVALLNGPVDREWGKRTASFTDPDGTIWEVAQDI